MRVHIMRPMQMMLFVVITASLMRPIIALEAPASAAGTSAHHPSPVTNRQDEHDETGELEKHRTHIEKLFRQAAKAEMAQDFTMALEKHRELCEYMEGNALHRHLDFQPAYFYAISYQARNHEELDDCEGAIATRQKLMNHMEIYPQKEAVLAFDEALCRELKRQAALPEDDRRKLARTAFDLFQAGMLARRAIRAPMGTTPNSRNPLLQQSNQLFQKAIESYREFHTDDIRIPLANFRMGQNLRKLEQFQDSNRCFEATYEAYSSQLGRMHSSSILTLCYIGRNMEALHEFEKAEGYFNQCLEDAYADGGTGYYNTDLGYYHLNLAEALAKQYRLVECRMQIEKAIDVLVKQKPLVQKYRDTLVKGRRNILSSWNMLTDATMKTGSLDVAIELNERAMKLRDVIENAPETLTDLESSNHESVYAKCMQLRGRVLLETGKPDQAISFLQQAIEIYSRRPGGVESHANTHELLAKAYSERGQYTEAVKHAELAIQLMEEHGQLTGNPVPTLSSRLALAKIHRIHGQPRKAFEILDAQGTQIRSGETSFSEPEQAMIEEQLAMTLAAIGDKSGAFESWSQSLELNLGHLEKHVLALNENNASQFLRSYHEAMVSLLGCTDIDQPDQIREAYQHVFRIKGLVSRIMRQQVTILRQTDPILASDVQQLESIRHQIANRVLQHHMSAEPKSDSPLSVELAPLNWQYEKVVGKLVDRGISRSVELNGSLDAMIRELPEDVALVDITPAGTSTDRQSHDRYFVFVLTRSGDDHQIRAAAIEDAQDIEHHVTSLLRHLDIDFLARDIQPATSPGRGSFVASRSALNEQVWKIVKSLLDEPRHIVICADGALAQMPWSILPGEKGKYLAEDFTFSTASDVQTLLATLKRDHIASGSGFLAVGGLDYGTKQSSGLSLEPLSTSMKELDDIRESLPKGMKVESITGKDADEEELMRRIRGKKYVLLSTHGLSFANPGSDTASNTLSMSAIALSGANEAGSRENQSNFDQLLTGTEILNSDLSTVELVVASACRTAAGKLQPGEGVMGIQQALMWAGADSTLTSRWNLSDQQASRFTAGFFKHLVNGKSKAESLQAVQVEMIDAGVEPKYWAPWTLAGDWR